MGTKKEGSSTKKATSGSTVPPHTRTLTAEGWRRRLQTEVEAKKSPATKKKSGTKSSESQE